MSNPSYDVVIVGAGNDDGDIERCIGGSGIGEGTDAHEAARLLGEERIAQRCDVVMVGIVAEQDEDGDRLLGAPAGIAPGLEHIEHLVVGNLRSHDDPLETER
jgi:hypothetical protein